MVLGVFLASRAPRAASGLEGQGDSQVPKEMWGHQDQRDPQVLQDLQGLKENQELQGRQAHQANGAPWGRRVSQGSRVLPAFLGPLALQVA